MESNEKNGEVKQNNVLPVENGQINVVVRPPQRSQNTVEIDIVKMFRNMKKSSRIYAWIMILCLLVGICVPLLMYGFNDKSFTATSVVMLTYDGSENLMAPSPRLKDGTWATRTPLDLSMVSSSYVLSQAVSGMTLSENVNIENLRKNISIGKVLTEESRRQQELISGMMDVSSTTSAAYQELMNMKLKYENQFTVSLSNGFGNEDGDKVYLTESEIRTLLDRILDAYNSYLRETYADLSVPDNGFDVIDTSAMDLLDSLELISESLDTVEEFVDNKDVRVRTYRSKTDGLSLDDLQNILTTVRDIDVDYLYAYVYSNSIVRDKDTMLTSLSFQKRNYEQQLDMINETITNTAVMLDKYKNDEIIVSSQEGADALSTTSTTDYYNELILSQVENYDTKTNLQVKIANIEDKMNALQSSGSSEITAAEDELEKVLANCKSLYLMICEHIDEINSSDMFAVYADHTGAQGRSIGMFSACGKKMAIFGVAGVFIGFCLWALNGITMQFSPEETAKKGGAAV